MRELSRTKPVPGAVDLCYQASATRPSASWQRIWTVFICAIVGSLFVHEVGHCVVAWLHGYIAIPTPAKEYVLHPLPDSLQTQVALGGILGSVAALVAAVIWLFRRTGSTRSALLAGAITLPGFYALRFFLFGRGHDGTEFQEAQAAVGLSYAGHALDWAFFGVFLAASALWFWKMRPAIDRGLIGRLFLGALVALITLVLLQSINNAMFDPLLGGSN